MTFKLSPQEDLIQRARAASAKLHESRIDRIEVGDPPPVYYPNAWDDATRSPISFFRDAYMAKVRPGEDPRAERRIVRHYEQSLRMQRGRHQAKVDRETGLPINPEQRAVTSGTLGGLIPPAYLGDLYAKAPRNGRVFADNRQHGELPEEGMSLTIPRITTASAAGMQTEGSAAATQDVAETDLSVAVRTVAAYLPVSRQTLERGQYSDAVLFDDLVARYAATLDSGCIAGAGTGVTILGTLNTANITLVTDNATASAGRVYLSSINAIQQVNTAMGGLGYAIDKGFMHPRRWVWLCAQTDTLGRPLISQSPDNALNYLGYQDNDNRGAIGYQGLFAGVPIYTDANIPITLGSGTNEDRIIYQASRVVHLWERPHDPVEVSFEARQATSLMVDMVVFGYCAFSAGRFPAASAVIAGSSLATPAF